MGPDILQLASEFASRGEPFALATVVRREPPSSARVGDKALITRAGDFYGWLGGSCTRPTAVQQALEALSDDRPRVIVLSPDPSADTRPGVTVLPMTCQSGGSVDIYIEPVLPAPRLLVFGVAPAAQTVARIGKVMGYVVEAVDRDADAATFPEADFVVTDVHDADFVERSTREGTRLYAVVATLGEHDEDAIRAALGMEPAYLGVVASRTRFAQIRDTLTAQGGGVGAAELDRISNPAGLDIGAVAPEEIALSVLAQIVQFRRAPEVRPEDKPTPEASHAKARPVDEHVDPVCGMTVDASSARHTAEFAGQAFFFCCESCRQRFVAEPERFALLAGAGGENPA